MSRFRSLLAAGCLGLASLFPASESAAQVQPGGVGVEVVRRALLGPGAWLLNFPDSSLDLLTGNATLTFAASGQAIMVRIRIPAADTGCERPVTLTEQGIAFDGCRETGIVLRYTPDDPVFAFRGGSSQRWYALRPHQ